MSCGQVGHRYQNCEKYWISIPRVTEWSHQMKLIEVVARSRTRVRYIHHRLRHLLICRIGYIQFDKLADAEVDDIADALRKLQVKVGHARLDGQQSSEGKKWHTKEHAQQKLQMPMGSALSRLSAVKQVIHKH